MKRRWKDTKGTERGWKRSQGKRCKIEDLDNNPTVPAYTSMRGIAHLTEPSSRDIRQMSVGWKSHGRSRDRIIRRKKLGKRWMEKNGMGVEVDNINTKTSRRRKK